MAGEITLTASLHRPVYHAMSSPQQAYVLLEAMPAAAALGTGAQSVNFSLVLDRSGSMAGEKLKQMKAAAKLVVDRLGPADLLSVVIFDDTADLVVPSSPVKDRETIKKKIDAIDERGGTHMSTGMAMGLQELQQGQSTDRVSSMLLLTDGQTWEDQSQCETLADQCRVAGVPINALGLGVGAESNWDPRLLEDLAQRSGGEWMVVDAPEKVGAVFASTLQAMQGTVATNASLTMRMVEGVMPRTVWRVKPLISRLGHQAIGLQDVQVFLGDVQHGIGQAILADVLFPPRKPGIYRLIQADVIYDVPSSGLTRQKASVDVVINFTDDAAEANQTDERLMNIIERVVAHKLQTQALDDAAAGNIAKATQRLRAAATRLLELGEVEMAHEAGQQAAQIEQAGQIDPAVAQKMRYATKKLTEADLAVEPEVVPTPVPTPEPEAEVAPELPPEAVPEPAPGPEAEIAPELPPEAVPELAPEPEAEIAPEPLPEAVPMPTPEPEAEVAPELPPEAVSEPTPEPEAEVALELPPEAVSEPAPEPEAEIAPELPPEAVPVPTPEPEAEVAPEPPPEAVSETAPKPDAALESPPDAPPSPVPGPDAELYSETAPEGEPKPEVAPTHITENEVESEPGTDTQSEPETGLESEPDTQD